MNNTMKKLMLLTFVFVFAFHAVSFAAVGGSKVRTAPSRPSTTQSAPAPSSNYKPSAPASSYTEKAPAAKSANPQTTAQQPASGGFMRNFGMFGGGMLLGGLLGSMFGFGHTGMFANMMGILFNIMLIAAIVMAGRYIWDKMRSNNRDRR